MTVLKRWRKHFLIDKDLDSMMNRMDIGVYGAPNQSNGGSSKKGSDRSMTAYETMLWTIWLPKVRSAIKYVILHCIRFLKGHVTHILHAEIVILGRLRIQLLQSLYSPLGHLCFQYFFVTMSSINSSFLSCPKLSSIGLHLRCNEAELRCIISFSLGLNMLEIEWKWYWKNRRGRFEVG